MEVSKDYEFADSEEEEEDAEEMEGEEEEEGDVKKSDSDNEEESDDSSDDDDDSDEESSNQTPLRKQLKDLSFEELESLKQKMGLKEYNEAMFSAKKGGPGSSSGPPKNKKRRKFEKVNKHRPKEMSSKVRVPKLRQVVKVPKKATTKDPRFDQSCGEFNEKIWNTEYSFIRDIQKKEAEDMKQKIKSVGEGPKQREMRRFIQRVTDKERSIEVKQQEEKKRIQDKEENRQRVKEGKRPFYMKKSTKKLVDLVEKYDELKASGKLEKYLKKKRKKNASRDKKLLNA